MPEAKSLRKNTISAPAEEVDNRTRILKASTKLFKEKGFSGVGVREIAQAAEVHLAAVNYYFRNKENLWEEALRFSFRFSGAQVADIGKLLEEARQLDSVEDLLNILRRAILRMLEDLRDPERDSGSLLMWEMAFHGQHIEMMIREFLRPNREILREIVRLLLPKASERHLDLWVSSIMGQCVYARQSLPLTKIYFNLKSQEECVRVVTNQTADFCISALRGHIEELKADSRPKRKR